LTYMVAAIRSVMILGGTSTSGFGVDIVVLVISTAVLVMIGAWLYPTIAY